MPPTPWRSLLLGAALVCGLGCGQTAEETAEEKARATLAEAPPLVRREVERTCDKWKPKHGGECDPAAVERDQIACWLEKGLPNLKAALKRGQGERTQVHRVLLHQNFCVEQKGWVYAKPGGGNLQKLWR